MLRVRAAYLEYRSGSSNKFYAVFTHRGRGMVVWGRLNTRGQAQEVDQAEAYERYGDKRGKGYRVVWDGNFDFHGEWRQSDLMRALYQARTTPTLGESVIEQDPKEQESIFGW